MFTISGYDITEQLYESAHSLVYRAYRSTSSQPVVLKVLKNEYPSPEELARFRREYEMTRNLKDTDGIIQVYSLEPYRNSLVIVLEDFGGDSLAQLLPKHPLELSAFLRTAIRITDILGGIHQQHIIHKDMNPSNIIWNPENDQLKIIDFGISTELSHEQPEIRNPEILGGTLPYISPEQTGRMNRAMDYRTDLYSLGVTLYEMLTGQLPFQSPDAMELVHCHLAKMPVPPCELPPHPNPLPEREGVFLPSPFRRGVGGEVPQILSDIIMKLLAKNAEDRYQSAYGLKYDLQWCLEQLQVPGTLEVPGTSPPFTIAQHDISERFQIPQKLYGRDQETATLLQAFDRITNRQPSIGHPEQRASTELLLVTGYAGIGKSSLVNEIQTPIVEKRGFFLSGKFDQLRRNTPYSAFIRAFQGFVRQLLSEPEGQISLWKDLLLETIGSSGQIMIDVIPDLELILGEQPPVPKLPPNQAQNRFNFVFQSFVQACASAEHPLAIFLDDLQWADWASLKLLELFMTDARTQHMLIIGAYRDNEVTDVHPVMLTLNEIQKARAAIETITLKPLALEHITQLVVETFRSLSEICTPFAELLLQKTGGNPFFLRQFLQTLYEDELLELDMDKGIWMWDLEAIQQRRMTDNVVELMANKIQKLPESTQQVLKLAACIGNQFDLSTLSIVSEHSPVDTLRNLWDALQEELILSLDDSYKYVLGERQKTKGEGQEFSSREGQGWVHEIAALHGGEFKFLHDRIQQAAYSLIEETQKHEVHLKIGRLLLSNTPEAEREEKIFDVVNHLNLGKDLISSRSQKDELVRLNLLTGRRAKASAAYQTAFTYLQDGIELLGAESWQRQYELTLALHEEAAEAAYLSGDFETMEQLAEIVFLEAKTLLDKVTAYEVKIQAYIAQNKLLESLKIAIPVLKLLGVKLPEKPTILHNLWGLFAVKLALAGKSVDDLSHLPEMTDRDKLAAMRLILRIISAAYFAVPKLLPLIGFKLVELSGKYGNVPVSAYGYAAYGAILCGFMGDIDVGYRFGQLALCVLEQFDAKEVKAKTLLAVNTLIRHWKEHAKNTLPPLLEAYQSGLESGDIEYAALAACIHSRYSYSTGKELQELERETAAYSEVIEQLKQDTIRNYHKIKRQAILNLIGNTESASLPCRLVGEVYNEEKMLSVHLQANDRTALLALYGNKLILCYLFQAYPQALENAILTETFLDAGAATLFVPILHFYAALSRLSVFSDASQPGKKRILRKIAVTQKKMRKWAYHAPMNYLHKWYLVEAERARVFGKDAEAMDYYDKAIEGARENKYLNEEALANEVAARFYLTRGKDKIAQVYMREARYCYLKWGAKAKVQHLDQTYPQLLAPIRERTGNAGPLRGTPILTDTTPIETGSYELDLATVIKASQAISGEIVLKNLLSRLMEIVVENAGAERGLLLFEEEGQWLIQAEKAIRAEAGPVVREPSLPVTIINYVVRTKEPVVLGDVTQEGEFTQDEYILARQPRSVLCIPLLNQGKLNGILYLENSLTAGVFTQKRLEIVRMLSSQAAISLENARLYTTLEQQVKERTAELLKAKEFSDASNQAKSEFLSLMSHELRTPLNSILGYAQLLRHDQKLTDKQHEAVATIHRSGEQLLRLISDLLNLSRIEARKIELNPGNFPLAQFLKNLVEDTRMRTQEKDIVFTAEIPSDLPAVVFGDEGHLRQILENLLNNAIQFTKEGKVTFGVTVVPEVPKVTKVEEEGQSSIVYLQLSIQDTGIGIPAESLQDIFLPFHQGKNGRTEGSGLGLAISQQLARLMKSELHVKSHVGQGSTFWFEMEFPIVEEKPENMLSVRTGQGPEKQRIVAYKGQRRRILLVDDHQENRNFLRDLLLPLGFDILEAGHGLEALNQVEHTPPDLILMDLWMPVMDGFEASKKIRKSTIQTVIVGISASVSPQVRQESLEAGCDDFLGKPVQIEDLLGCLHDHLGLEWIYADHTETISRQLDAPEPFSLIFPPQETLLELLEYAENGYISDIHASIVKLRDSDPNLSPFVDKVKQLTDKFQFEQLVELITLVLKET